VHCKSKEEAESLLLALHKRFEEWVGKAVPGTPNPLFPGSGSSKTVPDTPKCLFFV